MARTELHRAIFGSVYSTRRTRGSLCRAVGGHFAQNGQGHVAVQHGSGRKDLFANRAVDEYVLSSAPLHLIPVFGYACLAKGMATGDSYRVFKTVQADGAG